MSRQRLKADNVEQLLEIVRALQRGEEPTQESIRKNTESVPQADSPMFSTQETYSEQAVKKTADRSKTRKKEEIDDWDEEDPDKEDLRKKNLDKAGRSKKGLSKKDLNEEDLNKEDLEEDLDEDDLDEDDQEDSMLQKFGRSLNQWKNKLSGGTRRARKTQDSKNKTKKSEKKTEQTAEKKIEKNDTEQENPVSEAARTAARRSVQPEEAEAVVKRPVKSEDGTAVRHSVQSESAAESIQAGSAASANDDFADWEEDWNREFTFSRLHSGRRMRLTDTIEENERYYPSPKEEAYKAAEAKTVASKAAEAKNAVSKTADVKTAVSKTAGAADSRRAQDTVKETDRDSNENKAESAELEEAPRSAVNESKKASEKAYFADPEDLSKSAANESKEASEKAYFADPEDLSKSVANESKETSAKVDPAGSETSSKSADTDESSESKPRRPKMHLPKISKPEFSNRKGSSSVKNLVETLSQHGIGKRELGMIAAGIILVVLIVTAVVHMIGILISDSKKSEHVTADKELRVTVEEEPESWSSSYPVKLKFRVSKGEITEIRINGAVCEADEEGMVTYNADTWLLEAEADTDQNQTLKARVEISMLDGDAPVIHAALKENKIELTAADARSAVTGIYYAVIPDASKMELPEYQKYSEPIPYQEDCMYYFYAQDAAGNKCVPKVTNMKQAERLVLNQETLYLYPGESRSLMIDTEPAGALLENLRYESMNPELFTVSLTGEVTALAEGIGAIRISADRVADTVCTVEISNSRTVTISALGDCTLGTDAYFNTTTSLNAYDAVNGHSYFFKNVKSILEEDDITFANLEGTFTTSTERQDKQFAFKGDLDYTEILTSGSVEVVTLANNHSGDYGAQGLADTKTALDTVGIDYCIGDTVVIREVNGVSVAFIGIFVNYGLDASRQELLSSMEQAKKKGADLTIVAFHWGSEKATQPDETQISLAHTAIDNGADLVVGHHPHVLQGIEQYQGKYIAYSLGNFCFGGNSNPSDQDTMIFQQTFTVSADGSETEGNVKVIPCRISSVTEYNNYQPTPLQGDAGASIIQKLNTYSAPYQVSVAADGTVASSNASQM